ncbi:hypothetical protein B0T16DRAFT_389382 [Cercophora newfieldiana]|uniref:F-box domain-containing protein n=1 Tax=Cercophora newfieldiana TaxID=92897 RepID=A0AA40CUC4_9PEZI|nr:hypothetical protein B0T16DRAFT_389382 [Cercophora newfieldiana]
MDSLPTELLLEIPHHLPSTSDLASLSLASKRLYLIVNPLLYRRDASSEHPVAPFWGAEHNLLNTLRHSYAAGADLHRRRDFSKPRSAYGPRWRYVEPSTGSLPEGRQLRKRRSMSAFLDGGVAAPLPRYWWRPVDAAAFFGHGEVVRFLVEEVKGVDVVLLRSRGLCAFGLPGCGRPGVQVERRLEVEWTVHGVREAASCGGHRKVADLVRELQGEVETGRKGDVGKGTGDGEVGFGKDAGAGAGGVRVQIVEVGGGGGGEEVEFSYRDFVLERF